jgi:hypothetical protein
LSFLSFSIAWSVLLRLAASDYTLHSIFSENINSAYLKVKEKLIDIKGVNGRRTQYNGNKEQVQNDKQRSITRGLFF